MPTCPQCGQQLGADEHCATCQKNTQSSTTLLPASVPNQDAQQGQERAKVEVLEAEIVDEQDDARRAHGDRAHEEHSYGQGAHSGNAYWRVHGRGWQQQGGAFRQAGNELSCLPAFVTLLLGLSLGFQLGFLAALGFFFFYILGSALALTVSVRRTLMGKPVLVWFNRILVWIFAYVITYSLAT